MMSLTWSSVSLVAFFFFLQVLLWKRNANSKRLPPGPRGLPIIGSLHLLGNYPHRNLHKLAQKYGSIMFVRLGFIPTVVVSSPQAAELFLKTHDLAFASRPLILASKHIAYEGKTFIFAEYGSYWRTVRKIVTLELLSNLKIDSFRPIRKQELDLLMDSIKEAAASRVAVDISAKVSSLTANIACRTVFGKKYMDEELDQRGFKCFIQEAMELAATPNVGDYIPQIASLDLQGLVKRMKAAAKVFDAFFEKIIDHHLQSKVKNRTKGVVDVILSFLGSEETEYRLERGHIKAILLDLLVASMDTSATVVEWAVSALIKDQRVMKKVQKELETAVGLDKMVEESDLTSLEYLDMVLKETLRLYPVAPLLLPRESREDCTINGFHIPKQSRILINAWAIGRDPDAWTDAEKFIPERFAGSNIELNGQSFQLIPFGAGRRGCPGWQLGLTIVKLVLAQLIHCFDWELPNGILPSELDMTEEFSFVTPRAKHLVAIPTYRLKK